MRRLFLPLLALSLIAAACSGDEPAASTSTTPITTTTTSTTTTPPTTTTTTIPEAVGFPSPLNGLLHENEAELERRVMAVKIDNHWDARPQSGLQEADAVMELLVEGGLTRFISLFHSADSDYLGPIRSGRPTDPTLLKPLGATFTISGASEWVLTRIRSYGVPMIGEVRPQTFRIPERRAPHNLYGDTSLLRAHADERGISNDPPPPLFTFGEVPPGASSAERVELDWSNSSTVVWEWDGERYLRFNGEDPHEWRTAEEETGQVSVDTLVVMKGRFYFFPAPYGAALPSIDMVGRGEVLVFSQGKVYDGTWERATDTDPFVFTDASGEPLEVPSGIPWISFFPDTRTIRW